LELARSDVLAAALEDEHYVVSGTASSSSENKLHRTRGEIPAAAIGSAVHRHEVAAFGLGDKRHAFAVPANGTFHIRSPISFLLRNIRFRPSSEDDSCVIHQILTW